MSNSDKKYTLLYRATLVLAVVLLGMVAYIQVHKQQEVLQQAQEDSPRKVIDIGWVHVTRKKSLIHNGIPLVEYRVQLKGDSNDPYADHFERNAYAPIDIPEEDLLVRSVPSNHGLAEKDVYIIRYQGPVIRGVERTPMYFVKMRNPPKMTPW